MFELRYYVAGDASSPFEQWFSALDAAAAAKVSVALARLEQGAFSNVKTVGGVSSNTGSIGALDTESISGATVISW